MLLEKEIRNTLEIIYFYLRVGFGNNTFVAVGVNGGIYRSTDNGTTWDRRTSPSGTTIRLNGVAFLE